MKRKELNYIATHNINSLLQTGKLKPLTDELHKQNILIVGLQEMRNTTQEPFESQRYRVYNGIPGKRVMKHCPQFGNGFLVNLKTNLLNSKFQCKVTHSSNSIIKTHEQNVCNHKCPCPN